MRSMLSLALLTTALTAFAAPAHAQGKGLDAVETIVVIYADGFDSREVSLAGLQPGQTRALTIELQNMVVVNFGYIDFWAGRAGGALVPAEWVSNIVGVAAP